MKRKITGVGAALIKAYYRINDAQTSQEDKLKLSDVTFCVVSVCGRFCHKVYANRLICQMWSSEFEDMFACNGREIEITDVPLSVFEALIKFLYGLAEAIQSNANDGKFIGDLYAAAERFKIEKLKEICYSMLGLSTLTPANVFQFLDAAKISRSKELELRCIQILKTKTDEVLCSYDVQNLSHSMIEAVLNLDTVKLTSEYQLISWVYEWVDYMCRKCPEKKLDFRSPSAEILPYLKHFKFAELTVQEFGALVNKYEGFFDPVDGFKIFMNLSCPGTAVNWPSWYDKDVKSRVYKKKSDEDCSDCVSAADCIAEDPINSHSEAVSFSHSMSVGISDDTLIPHDFPLTVEVEPTTNLEDILQVNVPGKAIETPSFEEEEDSSWYSLPVVSRKKIKKKKIKRTYLLPGEKSLPGVNMLSSIYASGDFEDLVNTVWKQQNYGFHGA